MQFRRVLSACSKQADAASRIVLLQALTCVEIQFAVDLHAEAHGTHAMNTMRVSYKTSRLHACVGLAGSNVRGKYHSL